MNSYTQTTKVTQNETAFALGSGNLPVYSTPAMIAFMESTAIRAIDDLEGFTTVGIEINVKHLKASKIGEKISCTANLINHERKLYEFNIIVTDSKGDIIGNGTHKRIAVNEKKFMDSL